MFVMVFLYYLGWYFLIMSMSFIIQGSLIASGFIRVQMRIVLPTLPTKEKNKRGDLVMKTEHRF